MSVDDTAEQLRRQADDVDAICELHDYVTKPEWLFTDEDESGNEDTRFRQKKGERPGLAALDAAALDLAASGHAVAIVAWVPSRLFRDAGHKEQYFRRWARLGDVVVHTKQGIWSPRDPRDRFVSTVVAGADQYYSDDVREKVVRAHDERRRNGLPATGWPGFGHQRACGCKPKEPRCESAGHDRWIVVPEEADLLRDAVRRIVDGQAGLSTIVDEWHAAGVPTRLGGQWRLTTLRRVLTAPRLAGILVHNGVETGPSDALEPILDEALFRRLCERLTTKRHARPHRSKQLLTGVLVCGVCGGGLNSNMKKGTRDTPTRVYGCRTDGQCNIKAEAVEAVYVEKMFERLADHRFASALSRNDEEAARLLDELREQDAELEELTAHADRLPVAVYVAKFDAINRRVAELNRMLGQTPALDAATPWIGKVKKLRKVWEQMPTDEQRGLILSIVGRSKVLPAERRGRYASADEVKARLVPL